MTKPNTQNTKNLKDKFVRLVTLDLLAVFAGVGVIELLGGFNPVNAVVAAALMFYTVKELW